MDAITGEEWRIGGTKKTHSETGSCAPLHSVQYTAYIYFFRARARFEPDRTFAQVRYRTVKKVPFCKLRFCSAEMNDRQDKQNPSINQS
jgi:hypothetical protein